MGFHVFYKKYCCFFGCFVFFVYLCAVEVHDKILGLLVSFLGDYGKECGGWHSFNCPYCAEEKMVSADGHYNLEVMIDPDSRGFGGFHCWRCGEYSGMKGRLSSLVKRYGGEEVFAEFKRIVDEYRESSTPPLPGAGAGRCACCSPSLRAWRSR